MSPIAISGADLGALADRLEDRASGTVYAPLLDPIRWLADRTPPGADVDLEALNTVVNTVLLRLAVELAVDMLHGYDQHARDTAQEFLGHPPGGIIDNESTGKDDTS